MKTVVLFRSRSGFTKKYAEWIADELDADIFDGRKFDESAFGSYDVVIFGGSLRQGRINGISVIKRNIEALSGKRVIVFVTGGSLEEPGIEEEIFSANFKVDDKKRIRLYYYRGGFDFEKLGFFEKILMRGMRKYLLNKRETDLSEANRQLLTAFEKPADGTDRSKVRPLIEYATTGNNPA